MTMSMSRRANAWDNAPMASFFLPLSVAQTSWYRDESSAQARRDGATRSKAFAIANAFIRRSGIAHRTLAKRSYKWRERLYVKT